MVSKIKELLSTNNTSPEDDVIVIESSNQSMSLGVHVEETMDLQSVVRHAQGYNTYKDPYTPRYTPKL